MNKSFDPRGRQFAWDATSLASAEKCLRYYYYKHICGYYRPEKSFHLRFGSHYATALEHFYKYRALGSDIDTALEMVVLEALIDTWDRPICEVCQGQGHTATEEECSVCLGTGHIGDGAPWQSPDSAKTRENLIRTIIWYVDQFAHEGTEVIILSDGRPAVEYSFSLSVDNGYVFSGHIDRLVTYAKDPYVMDQKTTGGAISQTYFNNYSPDIQMCQPAGTMLQTKFGEVPIELVNENDYVLSYHNDSPSLRPRRVIGKAERYFSGHLISITAGQNEHKVTPNHRVLMRYAVNFKDKYAVYIMRKGNHFRIGTVQIATTREGGMNGISQRCRNERADAMWILDIYDSRKEAWFVEQLTSYQFGIPQVTFKASNFKNPESIDEDQYLLNLFWDELGNNVEKAKRILSHYGRDIDYPIYTTEESNAFSSTRAQMVRACNLLRDVTIVPVVTTAQVEWYSADIGYEPFEGMVYSLEVEKSTNFGGCYVANNIVTGNSMYTFAGKAIYNLPVRGVIIDAAQIAVGFTRFERGFTFRTESQLHEWYDEMMLLIERARKASEEQYFPMNRASCGNYGGCEFRGICSRSPEVRANFLAGDFKQGPTWDPLDRR